MMRLVAVHLLLLAGLAVHLCLGGAQADNKIFLYRGDSPNIAADGEGGLSSGGNADNTTPTNILGRDNLCVDVKDGNYTDGNPIQLWPCGNAQIDQLWTFRSDGTIRSNGTCMTASGSNDGDFVMIADCDIVAAGPKTWTLDYIGTIRNPQAGLVLTARLPTPGTTLTVNVDSNSSTQAWTPVNYTTPAMAYIRSSLHELCLQANGVNVRVWLANCIMDLNPALQWALYGDRTIRLYRNPIQCLTSDGDNVFNLIYLRPCEGIANQRWNLTKDGPILNPNAGLVMHVNETHQQIILYQPLGASNQQWCVFP